ncbi:MAG: hypothetical protein WBC88_04390 [Candidatus Zixiibacteriota bacterium]
MSKKYVFCLLLSFILFFLAVNAYAWDGQRKGFLLGFGIGPGFTSFTQKVTYPHDTNRVVVIRHIPGVSAESGRQNKAAVVTDFKIGYAPDNTWAIYHTSKVYFYGITNMSGWDVTIASGLGALAVSYWFKPQAPSPFVAGGLGYSIWALPFEDNRPDTWIGLGLFAGGGYEYSRHVSVEGYLSWGQPKHKESSLEVSSNALSVMLTVNVLGY